MYIVDVQVNERKNVQCSEHFHINFKIDKVAPGFFGSAINAASKVISISPRQHKKKT